MIEMTQVRVPIDVICQRAPAEEIKRGRITPQEEQCVREAVGRLLHIAENQLRDFQILRRSIDARKKKDIKYTYHVRFQAPKERQLLKRYGKPDGKWLPSPEGQKRQLSYRTEKQKASCRPVIAGLGPAGLFAALELARAGLTPLVLERGEDVTARLRCVEHFWETGELNPECNVQFGEGGAGAFSDGKLNTLVKDREGRNRRVLETFVEFGAPSEILYLQKPHIGTDRLRQVVKQMRDRIIELGGEVRFGTVMEQIICEEGKLKAIQTVCEGRRETIPCRRLILATGHSARDTFAMLAREGISMAAKPFAVGVRVEHPQQMIGKSQYGEYADRLPAADYKLTYTTKSGRGVYSFCMCPGGFVVNASSEPGRLAVNGMSNYARDTGNANSAIVVTVHPGDFDGEDVLAGMAFQRRLEEAAYQQAAGKIPVQLFGDFLRNCPSRAFGDILPSMKGEYTLANVRSILPDFIGDCIAEGIQAFDRKIRGYARTDALLSGVESRTSSPVKILRDISLQASIRGIYPCGEGAGYAGGITSAAMDGMKVAEQILSEADDSVWRQ